MTRITVRERLLVVLGLIALAVFLALVVVVLPLRQRLGRVTRQERSLEQQLSEADLTHRSLPRVKEEIGSLNEQIAALSRPDQNPTPEVVRQIERLTSDLGVQLTSVRPSEPEYASACTRFPTTFEVQSSFPSLVQLLFQLERPPYNLWVEGAEMNMDRDMGVLRTAITVSVYSCKPTNARADEKG